MKKLKRSTLSLLSCLLISSFFMLKPMIANAQIPQSFVGVWADKQKPSVTYCYPPTDNLDYVLWSIKPSKNLIQLIGFAVYEPVKFYSLSPTGFTAKVAISQADDEDMVSVTYEDISLRLLNKNTITINDIKYYRCPKSPY